MEISVPVLDGSGRIGAREVDASRFRRRGKKVLLKEYVVMAEARQRVGTHATLTRAEVTGTTAKMYRQKGTGNARHGNRKAAQLRGGGVAFAKKPRDYGWAMPKRARRAALEATIRFKLEDGEVRIVESLDMSQPSTREFLAKIAPLGLDGTYVIVPSEHSDSLWRSCRNVTGCGYTTVGNLNAYEALRRKYLVLDAAAYKALEERFDG